MENAKYQSLDRRSVFVTGGAQGIGASFVRAFVRQGAKVAFIDVDERAARALIGDIQRECGAIPFFQICDVRDTEQLQRSMHAASLENDSIGVLINNAANDARHAFADLTPAGWNETLAVNLTHMAFAAKEASKQMRAHGGGSIINLGSICWKLPNKNIIGYSVSKAAVHGLTRSLAKELGGDMIRVNTLSPGWVMTEKQKRDRLDPEAERMMDLMQCMPVRIMPDDIAEMALFLASNAARCCTGQEFIVDAGWV
jgi:NAD(P)-dependent dehydrogenase (short-subunit alcohol dehydrogenase family)